jgi:hypothetical protein
MNKLSSIKVAEVLAQVPHTLRAQQEEIRALREKVAHFEKRDRVVKIASEMQAKNLDPETSLNEKVESLMGHDDLDVYEKAIELSAPQVKLAALSDHPGNASDAESAFISALVGE